MIPSGVEIFVAVTPIDLRWGFDRLAGLASEQIGRAAVGTRRTASGATRA